MVEMETFFIVLCKELEKECYHSVTGIKKEFKR